VNPLTRRRQARNLPTRSDRLPSDAQWGRYAKREQPAAEVVTGPPGISSAPAPAHPPSARVGPYFVTLSLVVALCVRVPLFPVMVSVKVPLGPDDEVLTVSVDVLVVNVTVEPDGWPLRLRVTEPEKPLDGLTVTV
jgi:hypothetical protein